MDNFAKWLDLQLFADGGGDGAGAGEGAGAAETGANTPDAGEARLRELGVPESVLAKRAKRAKTRGNVQAAAKVPATEAQTKQEPTSQQDAAVGTKKDTPAEEGNGADSASGRMTWDEIMADPEYNRQMQSLVQARLKESRAAEDTLGKLGPMLEMLAKRHGMDAKALDAEALTRAVMDDDTFYEDKALEMGVTVETAKKIQKAEQETARQQEAERHAQEEQKIHAHLESLQRQTEAMKDRFPNIDLQEELKNPVFFRMTSPSGGISVEDAYYAVHRKEIQAASMKATAENTAKQMANAIRAGQTRPVENGTSTQAPSVTSFDYAHASKEQREALKRRIREAAAHGKKLYPGQV